MSEMVGVASRDSPVERSSTPRKIRRISRSASREGTPRILPRGAMPNKSSLDFILSPSPGPSTSTTHHSASSPAFSAGPSIAYGSPRSARSSTAPLNGSAKPRLSLDDLPRDVLANIAFNLVVDHEGVGRHPCALLPFMRASKHIHDSIAFDNNPTLWNLLFRATYDHAALTRRFQWMRSHLANAAKAAPPRPSPAQAKPVEKKTFDLFADPRSWAMDYKNRWETAYRMRQAVRSGRLDVHSEGDKEQLCEDLWTIWFLLTENDGKNVPFLAEHCYFQEWIRVYYRDDLLKDSIVPGYPKATGDKALGIWCALLSGTDAAEEQTPAEVDEKIFMLRPYVFACAKYEVTYAPWHHRRLPLGPAKSKEEETDVTLQSKAIPYKRFGFTWRRAPPHFILGAYLVFFRLLERHSNRVGMQPNSSTFSMPPALRHLPGLFSTTRILPSFSHDREWQRNSVCQDPHTSPGLPATSFIGELQGFWRGKFLFYNFESYRQILSGDMRALYTGDFAEQAAEMELHETVIRVRAEDLGGTGPMLTAGFDDNDDAAVSEVEQRRIRSGYGHEVLEIKDGRAVDALGPDEPGWTKEILLSGRLRTSWGWAAVRGRVRAWDGLVVMAIAYSPHVMGKWLWRGYLHTGGYFIGRWRDSFTPEELRGNEGAIGMVRAGSLFYPPHFPQRMEDSLGLRVPTPPGGSSQAGNGGTQQGAAGGDGTAAPAEPAEGTADEQNGDTRPPSAGPMER